MKRGEKIPAIHRFKPGTKVYAKVRGRWRRCVIESFQAGFFEWRGADGRDWFGLKDRVLVRPLRGRKTYDLVADRRYVQVNPPANQLTLTLEENYE